ncbi:MAG: mechanosensitive ion channel family protein [Nibricoccus sp.]
MKRLKVLFSCTLMFLLPVAAGLMRAADAAPAPADPAVEQANNTAAAAAVASGKVQVAKPGQDLLEHLVDVVLQAFNVESSGNTVTHYVISALFLVGAFLLRHLVARIFFAFLKKLAARTETTLDDKMFPALEAPVAAFITVTGIFAALKVLKLTEAADRAVGYGATVAFSLVIFWGLFRAFNALLEHLHEVAVDRQMGIAAFMPWIKKTLIAIFVVIGALMVIQSLGYNVSTLLQGLGIGGLAFALAAQDTIANLFGSLVVATDQPFKLGETVKIGDEVGMVEDIGLRSTKIRKVDRSLLIIPNKSVAGGNIINLSRFNGRRVEQVLGLTYDATAAQIEELVGTIKNLLQAEPAIDTNSVNVYFRDFSASSLDIWLTYNVKDPDFAKHMALRQRLNLTFMKLVEERGLSMAFPTQTIYLENVSGKKSSAPQS